MQNDIMMEVELKIPQNHPTVTIVGKDAGNAGQGLENMRFCIVRLPVESPMEALEFLILHGIAGSQRWRHC